MADGSVVFDVNLNASQANKKLAKLKGDIKKTEKELADLTQKRDAAAQKSSPESAAALDAEKRKVRELKKEYEKFRELSKDKTLSPELRDYNKTRAQQAKIDYDEQKARVRALESEWNKAANEVEKYNAKIDAANQKLNQQTSEAGELAQQIQAAEKPKFTDNFKGIDKSLKSALSAAVKLTRAFKDLFRSNTSLNTSFSSSLKTMLKYGLGIRSLYALFNKLRAALKEGMKNLAQYSGEVNGSLSSMKSALTQLKNSLATAFAPILTAVEPAITRLISLCSAAADAIARLVAMLSGKSAYTRAIAVQEDYADALKGTGGAAKEAAKQLASFDEIEKLTTKDAAGGGGGSSIGDMFETVDIEPLEFASWGEAFSAMLDKILKDGIPKLKEGLTNLAAWINDFAAKLYEAFTFPGVYEKVVEIAHQLAEALNDFANDINWEMIGRTLGAGLNLALGFLAEFIYTFNWKNLGKKLAEAINGFIKEIDWKDVGKLLWAKFKIALETFIGFIYGLDTAEIAKAASDIIIGFFESAAETIENIDWQDLGNEIYNKVKDFLVNIEWAEIADATFEAIGAAFGAATAFLWGLIQAAWNDVVNWWHEAAYEDGQFTLEGLLGGIKQKIKDIGAWIKEHIFQPFINGFKAAFGIASPSTVMMEMGGYLIDGLHEGLKGIWDSIGHLFTDTLDDIGKLFSFDALKGIGKTMIEGLLAGLKDAWDSVTKWVTDAASWIQRKFDKAADTTPTAARSGSFGGASTYSIADRVAVMPKLSIGDIPALAAGAVIPPNREFLAVLGDQTRGYNIEAPEDKLQAMADRAASANTELLREILQAIKAGKVIEVDKQQFGQVVNDAYNTERARIGTRFVTVT